jgi:predicted metal-dependent hydrolase
VDLQVSLGPPPHSGPVPVTVYAGYDWEAISRFADEDNENDEYHVPVPLPDVWAEYARLQEQEGWAQEKIAEAKGVVQAAVSERIRFAGLPLKIQHTFIKHDFLKECAFNHNMAKEARIWLKTEKTRIWLKNHARVDPSVSTV